jgi:hypothetical protein
VLILQFLEVPNDGNLLLIFNAIFGHNLVRFGQSTPLLVNLAVNLKHIVFEIASHAHVLQLLLLLGIFSLLFRQDEIDLLVHFTAALKLGLV